MSSWAAHSVPQDADEYREVDLRKMREWNAAAQAPRLRRKPEPIPPAPVSLNFRDLSHEGFFHCRVFSCSHIQRKDEGEVCTKCGHQRMKWAEPVL